MMHPTKYASMLAEKMQRHGSTAWLANTGWAGGSYGVGSRMKLGYTRAIIDAIHDGWKDKDVYNGTLKKLAALFQKNFCNFADYEVGGDSNLMQEILNAGPLIQ
ncbi:hypothetical protein R1sor_025610 [Riccia sorocarpa]|uniref:Phosphoenolpyruvate carboxykinase n=1 Tax=Riccia sorocarpa TaxID=122646 RepID=A0ABD3G943_9MARC